MVFAVAIGCLKFLVWRKWEEKWRNRTCGFGRISVHLTRHLSRVISLFREASKCIISGYAMTGIE